MTGYEVFEGAAIAAAVLAAAGFVLARLRPAAKPARDHPRACASGCDGCGGCPPPARQRIRFVARASRSSPDA